MKNHILTLSALSLFWIFFSCVGKKENLHNNQQKIAFTNIDLGLSLEEILKKINKDTSDCTIQNEPPGIARGIEIEKDSTMFYFQISRKANFKNKFKDLMNEKVIGIGIAYPNCSKENFGEGFLLNGIENKYCKD